MTEERKIKKLVFGGTTRFFVKSKIHKKYDDQKKKNRNLHISIDCPKITHFSISSSNLTVKNKKIIPMAMFNVKIKISFWLWGKEIFGPINATPNPPAEKFINKPEKALSHALEKLINFNVTNSYLFVKQYLYC